MMTLIRFFQLKAKEIKFKLHLYLLLEQVTDEIMNHKDEWKNKFIHELAEMIHDGNGQEQD